MNDHYHQQAYCNRWSNHRLLNACAELTHREFVAERTSFFPSIWQTLNHINIVDAFYIDSLEGGTLGLAAFNDETPYPSIVDLIPAQRALDLRLIRFCEALDPARLATKVILQREDRQQIEATHRVLSHLFVHQTHHRGQVHAMLCGTHVAPPQLDEFYLADEAPLRRDDFKALGISERQVW